MISMKLPLKLFKDESYRIFVIAILASFLWHLLWLSTITIVSQPDNAHPVKFSKVSFLGPLLGKGAMELQARPKERSFLENRYLGAASRLPNRHAPGEDAVTVSYETGNSHYYLRDEAMITAISDALALEKIEPPHDE